MHTHPKILSAIESAGYFHTIQSPFVWNCFPQFQHPVTENENIMFCQYEQRPLCQNFNQLRMGYLTAERKLKRFALSQFHPIMSYIFSHRRQN